MDLKNKTFIVQGFGNVGYWAAHFLEQAGAKMVGVQDAFGTIANQDGLAVEDVFSYAQQHNGSFVGFPGSNEVAKEVFFSLNCDICIPAALGNQITANNALDIKAFLIAEGANGPTTVEAEKILLKRGIEIIPDILCNSGGVIGSYFEWLQNRNGELWELDEILFKIDKKIKEVFKRVLNTSETQSIDMRTAAYVIAIERIEKAYIQRGIFP